MPLVRCDLCGAACEPGPLDEWDPTFVADGSRGVACADCKREFKARCHVPVFRLSDRKPAH